MSAIAGIVDFSGAEVAREELALMAAALAPYGRDLLQITAGEGAGFAACIDIRTAEDRLERQPAVLGDGGQLLFAGRLDNRAALATALAIPVVELRRMPDSAVAARAWARWGEQALDRLVGHFSLAHWAPADRRLSLAGSAPKGRPLYYFHQGSRLYFASAPPGLFALPQIPRELDEQAVADVMRVVPGCYESPPFRGIHKVENGDLLTATAKRRERRRYWTPDPGHRLRFRSEEEAWEALRALFREVVESQLRTIEPPAVLMSGGLDSAAVVGQTAQLLADQPLRGYTRTPLADAPLRPDGMLYNDERARVELIARRNPNLIPSFVDPGDTPVLAGMSDYFGLSGRLTALESSFQSGYRVLYQRAAADGVRVMLTGAHGNNTHSYSGFERLVELQRRGRWLALYREIRAIERFRGYLPGPVRRMLAGPQLVALVRMLRRRPAPAAAPGLAIHPDLARRTGASGHRPPVPQTRDGAPPGWWERVAALSRTNHTSRDTFRALYGIELRDPCGDRRVTEFCLALPLELFLSGGVERRLTRKGLAPLIPEAMCMDPTRGVTDVDGMFRIGRDHQAIGTALEELEGDARVAGYLDLPLMRDLWRRLGQSDWRHSLIGEEQQYRRTLLASIGAGQFIRWAEGGA